MPRAYDNLTLAQLKAELQQRRAKISGRKRELIARYVLNLGDNICKLYFIPLTYMVLVHYGYDRHKVYHRIQHITGTK